MRCSVIGKEAGNNLRKMADLSYKTIVVFGRDHVWHRADRSNDVLHSFQCNMRSGAYGAKKERCVVKQVRTCGFRTRLLQARHGMSTNKAKPALLSLTAYRGLGASYIRDQRLIRRELIEKFENVSDRRRQHDEVRRLRTGDINNFQPLRASKHLGPVDASDASGWKCAFERESEGPSDETGTVNGDVSHIQKQREENFSSLTSSTAGQPVQSSLAATSTRGIARDRATARRRKAQFLEHGEPQLKRRRHPLPPRHEPLAEPCLGGLFREKDRPGSEGGRASGSPELRKCPACSACSFQKCESRAHKG